MCNFYTIVSQTLNFAIKRFLRIYGFPWFFFYFTLAIQQNIYFSHFPWQQFNVQLRKYKARGLIASGYTIQTSWWWRLWAARTLYSFSNSLFRNILQIESMSWSRSGCCCFVYNSKKKKKRKERKKNRLQRGCRGVYVQPFDWEISDLM